MASKNRSFAHLNKVQPSILNYESEASRNSHLFENFSNRWETSFSSQRERPRMIPHRMFSYSSATYPYTTTPEDKEPPVLSTFEERIDSAHQLHLYAQSFINDLIRKNEKEEAKIRRRDAQRLKMAPARKRISSLNDKLRKLAISAQKCVNPRKPKKVSLTKPKPRSSENLDKSILERKEEEQMTFEKADKSFINNNVNESMTPARRSHRIAIRKARKGDREPRSITVAGVASIMEEMVNNIAAQSFGSFVSPYERKECVAANSKLMTFEKSTKLTANNFGNESMTPARRSRRMTIRKTKKSYHETRSITAAANVTPIVNRRKGHSTARLLISALFPRKIKNCKKD